MPTNTDKVATSENPDHQKNRPSFLHAVTLTGIGTVINVSFLLFETMIIARQLDTTSLGVYALLIVVVNFLVLVIDFGCVTSVTQLIASSDSTQQEGYAKSAILLRILNVTIISTVLLLGRNVLNLIDSSQILVTFTQYIPLMLLAVALDELFIAILQGKQCYQQMAIAQIMRSIIRLGLTAVLIYVFDLGLLALIYSWIISYGVSITYEYIVMPFSKTLSMNWQLLRGMLRFGLPIQLNNFLWFASTSSQSPLLSIFLGPSAVAFYEVALRIPNALLRLSQAYSAVFFPTITGLLAERKGIQARKLLERSLSLTSFLMTLVALTSVLFNHEIVTLLFSEKYSASGPTFAFLMIALHMTVLVTLMGYSLTAAGYPSRSLGVNAIREAMMFLLNLLLIPISGFIAPAYSKIISFYIANPISVWLLRKSSIRVNVAPYVKQTILLLIAAGVFWLVHPESILLRFLILGLFIVFNYLFSTISLDDWSLIMPDFIKHRLGIQPDVVPTNQ